MKLLFDQNLSPRLVKLLSDLYPGSTHVFHVKLDRATDRVVWRYALDHELTILKRSRDSVRIARAPF